MKVLLRNPKRELDVPAPRNVGQLLRDLDVVAESVLVIRNDTLATHDERLSEDDVVEIRPVVSGGLERSAGGVANRRSSSSGATTPDSVAIASFTIAASRCGARSTSTT